MKNVDINNLIDKLEKSKNTSLDDIDINEIDDIENIKISRKKSSHDRIIDFITTVKNPYIFKIGNRLVKIEFSDKNRRAEDSLLNVIESLYK